MSALRPLLLWMHRMAGLSMAGFLVIASLTGAILAFAPRIELTLNPETLLPERPGALMDVFALRDRAEEILGQGVLLTEVLFIVDRQRPYQLVVLPRPDPVTGKSTPLDYLYLELDPVTGKELRRYKPEDHGLWPLTRKNLIGVLFNLHRGLLLPGKIGTRVMGVVAMVWVMDCLVALALTFPSSRATSHRSWLARWWNPGWLIKQGTSSQRRNRDVHRASGLWLWLALLGMALSAVALGLHDEVFMPILNRTAPMANPVFQLSRLPQPRDQPQLGWREARQRARELMAETAREQGFTLRPDGEFWISYDRDTGAYLYDACSSRDKLDEGCGTILALDGNSGQLLAFQSLTGFRAGNTINFWLHALHMGMVGGTPYKAFLVILGLGITVLSVTGVYIWWQRRDIRRAARQRSSEDAAA